MQTTMTIARDGTVTIRIPSFSDRGTVGMEIDFPKTEMGNEGLWTFACRNNLQMGEVISEDTMEITLRDHPPRR